MNPAVVVGVIIGFAVGAIFTLAVALYLWSPELDHGQYRPGFAGRALRSSRVLREISDDLLRGDEDVCYDPLTEVEFEVYQLRQDLYGPEVGHLWECTSRL